LSRTGGGVSWVACQGRCASLQRIPL